MAASLPAVPADPLALLTHVLLPDSLVPLTPLEDNPKGSKLSKEDLNELRAIWERDPVMPEIEWRKAWAESHGLKGFANVTGFFRRKQRQAERLKAQHDQCSTNASHVDDESSSPRPLREIGAGDLPSNQSLPSVLHHQTTASVASSGTVVADLHEAHDSPSAFHTPAREPPTPLSATSYANTVNPSVVSTPTIRDLSMYPDGPIHPDAASVLLARAYGLSPAFDVPLYHAYPSDPHMPSLSYSPGNSPSALTYDEATPSVRSGPLYLPEDEYMRMPAFLASHPSLASLDDDGFGFKIQDAGPSDDLPQSFSNTNALGLYGDLMAHSDELLQCSPVSRAASMQDDEIDQSLFTAPNSRQLDSYMFEPEFDEPFEDGSLMPAFQLHSNSPASSYADVDFPLDFSESPILDEHADDNYALVPYTFESLTGPYAYQTDSQLAAIEQDIETRGSDDFWDELVETSYRINQSLGL